MSGGVKPFPKKLEDMMFIFVITAGKFVSNDKKYQLQNILILQRLIALSNLIIDWNRSRHCNEYVSRIELLKINDNVLALYKYI